VAGMLLGRVVLTLEGGHEGIVALVLKSRW
jgi:hypothetical protein